MFRHLLIAGALLCVAAPSCGDPADTGQQEPDVRDVAPADLPPDEAAGPEWVTALPDRESPGMAFHEHSLNDELGGFRLNRDDTVVAFLEHPTVGLASENDLGSENGVDDYPFEYFEQEEHTFCWEGDPDGDPHFMTLHDAEGKELLRVDEGGECKTLTITPGRYTKRLHHSGRGQESGHNVFLGPAVPGTPRKLHHAAPTESAGLGLTATSNPCQMIRTISYADIGKLAVGEVAFATSCTADSGMQLAVFSADCPDVATPMGNFFTYGGTTADKPPPGEDGDDMDCCWLNWYALTTPSNLTAVVPGPSTSVVMFQGAAYTGRSVTFATPLQLNCVNPDTTLGPTDAHHDSKRSFKVFTKFLNATDGGCSIAWSGPATALFSDPNTWGGPAEGEAYLFTEKGLSGDAYKFTGPCYDLGSICALDSLSSIHIGPNTVVYLYKGVGFLGENFPYKAKTVDLADYSDAIESLYLEPLTVYNNNTTLIKTNNCDKCNLAGLKLVDGESLVGASLVGANLHGAQLNSVNLTGGKLTGANLTQAVMLGAVLKNVDATGANFRGATLSYASLQGANLTNALFDADSTYKAAVMGYTYMPNANLTGAHLTGVTLAYAQIYGANATVTGAYLQNANLSNAILANMNLKQAQMKGVQLTGAVLISANLSGADLTGANLINASLQGADFSNALLYGASLQNATIALAPGNIQVTRLGDDNTLVTVQVSFSATIFPKEVTDKDTVCPNGATSMDGNVYCDAVDELTAPAPPSPPKCVPSLTNFCPPTPKK